MPLFWKKYNKKDRSPCLFRWYNGQTYPMYACAGNNHACRFIGSQYILLYLAARVFKVKIKILVRKEVSSVWNNLIDNLWENHANVNDFDSKRFTSPSFQGHDLHPRVMGFVHAFSFIFFSPSKIFCYLSNLKGINWTPKLCKKIIGHLARSRNKDHRTSLPSLWIEEQYYVLRMRMLTFPWLRDFNTRWKTEESPEGNQSIWLVRQSFTFNFFIESAWLPWRQIDLSKPQWPHSLFM